MKKLALILFAILSLCVPAMAQTVGTATVTAVGNFTVPSGSTLTLQAQIVGCDSDTPLYPGPTGSPISITPNQTATTPFTAVGQTVTFTVPGNDQIYCGGQAYTRYAITWLISGRPIAPTKVYRFADATTVTLSSLKPLGFVPPTIANAYGSQCPTGQILNGYDVNFVPQCQPIPVGSLANTITGNFSVPTGNLSVGGSISGTNGIFLNPVNVQASMFGVGQTISTLTLSPANPTCTSGTPVATIPAPASPTGTQAVALLGCADGFVYVDMMINEGGGYSGTVTGTISGAGTSGATFTAVLRGNPGPADPLGINCSDNAIQSAISYALAHPASLTGPYPLVYLPGSFTSYKLCATINKPSVIRMAGDTFQSTNLTTSGNFPHIVDFRDATYGSNGGGLSHLNFVGNGSASTTDMTQQEFLIENYYSDLNYTNSGGECFNSEPHNERNHYENIICSQVRTGGILGGNEDYFEDIDGSNLGITASNFAYSINSVNGAFWNQGYTAHTVVAAATDGSGGAYWAVAFPTAPIVAGMWFNATNIGDITQMNGIWQVVKILNGCSAATSPYTSASTCLTVNAADFVAITTLTTGTRLPDGDWQDVVLQNPTTLTPAAGSSSSLGTATWSVHLFTAYNPAWLIGGSISKFVRSSTKATQFGGGVVVHGDQNEISNFYVEGAVQGGGSPAVAVGGQAPYFVGNSPIVTNPVTGAYSVAHPGTTTVVSAQWAQTRTFYNYQFFLNLSQIRYEIVCPDYNPSSSAPCALYPGVNQNQFENVLITFNETPPYTVYVLARNQSGSTAPANTAWGASGNKFLIASLPQQSGIYSGSQFEALIYNDHLNSIVPIGSGFSTEASVSGDAGAFADAEIAAGVIPDFVTVFPPGTVGQGAFVPGIAHIYNAMEPGGQCPANENLGNECIKGFSRATIIEYGNQGTVQSEETAAGVALCQFMNSIQYPTILTNYAGGLTTVGSIADLSQGMHASRMLSTGGTGCLYMADITQNQNTFHTTFANTYLFQDLAGNDMEWIFGTAGNMELKLDTTPVGGTFHNYLDLSPTRFSLFCQSAVVSTSHTTCPQPPLIFQPSHNNGTTNITDTWEMSSVYNNGGATPPTTFTGLDTVTFSGLTTLRDLSQWGSVKLPTTSTIGTAPIPVTTVAPTAGQAACIKSVGPPITIGTCSTVVGAGGACTCN